MIIYESNKSWLRDVGHLYKSWTMQKVMRSTIAVCAITAVICYVYMDIFEWKTVENATVLFTLLGVVLSILLSFRTNSAYDRWWEGRKLWGSLVNNSRNLAVYVHSILPSDDKKSREYIALRIANFAIALKEHLRSGVKMEELVMLSDVEIKKYKSRNHIVNYIAYELIQRIQDIHQAGHISTADHINLKLNTQEFLNISGACERIKKTPIPFSYNVYLKLFISIYSIGLPFALIPLFGYWAILMVGFVFFAFIGLELMAEEIEDPFGLDCNDLPTGDIANTIKNNVFEIFEVNECDEEKEQEMYSKVF